MNQQNNNLNDDFSKIFNTAASSASSMFNSFKNNFNQLIESYLINLNLVKREEFEVLKAMLAELRLEQEELKNKISMLEKNNKPKKSV